MQESQLGIWVGKLINLSKVVSDRLTSHYDQWKYPRTNVLAEGLIERTPSVTWNYIENWAQKRRWWLPEANVVRQ